MNRLMDIDGSLITRYMEKALISFKSQKIINTLLDGTSHVQTIGTPQKNVAISCAVVESGKSILDEAYINDIPIKLEWDSQYYIGILNKKPEWSYLLKDRGSTRIYDTKLELLVNDEGIL